MAITYTDIRNRKAQAEALDAVDKYLLKRQEARKPAEEQDFQKIKEYTDDEGNVFITTGKLDASTGQYSDTQTQNLGQIGKPKSPSEKTIYTVDNLRNTAKVFGVEEEFKNEINYNFEEAGIKPNSIAGQAYIKKNLDLMKNYKPGTGKDLILNYESVLNTIENTFDDKNSPEYKKATRLLNSTKKIKDVDVQQKRFTQALAEVPSFKEESSETIYDSPTLKQVAGNAFDNYLEQQYPEVVRGDLTRREEISAKIKEDTELNKLYRQDIRQKLAFDSRNQQRAYQGQVVTNANQIDLTFLQNTELFKEFIRAGNPLPAKGLPAAQGAKEMEMFTNRFFEFVSNKQNSYGSNPADAFDLFIANPITPESIGRRPSFQDARNRSKDNR